ncbi:MAG TPA: hypothetical protein VF903_07795 [Nitrospirota bacterium]
MKKNFVFPVVAAAVLTALFFLSTRTKVPFIPSDELHQGATTPAACGECHAPEKRAPLKANHPPKEQCFICHRVKK